VRFARVEQLWKEAHRGSNPASSISVSISSIVK